MIQKPGGVQVSKQDSLDHDQCKVCVSGHPEATKVQNSSALGVFRFCPTGNKPMSMFGHSNVLVE